METLEQMRARHAREEAELVSQLVEISRQIEMEKRGNGEMRVQTIKVAEKYNIPVSDITGPGRQRVFNQPRREIWSKLSDKGYSLSQIGYYFRRHHTTILHGIQQYRASQ